MNTTVNNNTWVAKFGGTSVGSFAAMKRCAAIIANHPQVRVVVVSAPAGVTNLLIKLSQTPVSQLAPVLEEIKAKVQSILSCFCETVFANLHQEIANLFVNLEQMAMQLNTHQHRQHVDELLAYGERFSAHLFTALLSSQGVKAIYQDARELIKTNDYFGKATVCIQTTKQQVNKLLVPQCANQVVVTEGFIGSTNDQQTTTLGRGGSDYSAALLAEAIHAAALQIWTDVSGIYTADPRMVKAAKPIQHISFNEAAELATFGAKVLHPATLWPAIRQNIPVFVGSSMESKASGTWIRATYPERVSVPTLQAITLRHNQTLLTINSLEMLHTHGFLAKIFTILAKHELSVDLVTTSEVSVALTLNHADADTKEQLTPDVLAELQAIGNVSLKVDRELCLIALIGNQLSQTSGVSGKVFHLLQPFNIRLINHGASPHNLCLLVDQQDATSVVQLLHKTFFETSAGE